MQLIYKLAFYSLDAPSSQKVALSDKNIDIFMLFKKNIYLCEYCK